MLMLSIDSSPERVRDAWAAVLESNTVKQTKSCLRKDYADDGGEAGYCCLGVLCELAVEAGVIDEYAHYAAYPPENVTDWAGIATESGAYGDGDGGPHISLADDNDYGERFVEIAATIRREPMGLIAS